MDDSVESLLCKRRNRKLSRRMMLKDDQTKKRMLLFNVNKLYDDLVNAESIVFIHTTKKKTHKPHHVTTCTYNAYEQIGITSSTSDKVYTPDFISKRTIAMDPLNNPYTHKKFISISHPCFVIDSIIKCVENKEYFGDNLLAHISECIHCSVQCLLELFNNGKYLVFTKSNINSGRILEILFNHKLIRKQYILNNKQLLTLFIINCCNKIISNYPQYQNKNNQNQYIEQSVLESASMLSKLLWFSKQKQYKFIFKSKSVTKLLCTLFELSGRGTDDNTILNNSMDILFVKINRYHKAIHCVLHKMHMGKRQYSICQKLLTMPSGMKMIGQNKFLRETSYSMKVNDYKMIKCGNIKCRNSYFQFKQNEWSYNKRNKWSICSGCKIVYFCTRKCQKISWNTQNHKYHCKLIGNNNRLSFKLI